MPSFVCYLCGQGSLVRSNFKFTQERTPRPYCRASLACSSRTVKRKEEALFSPERQRRFSAQDSLYQETMETP